MVSSKSPILFTIFLDKLISRLTHAGIGYHFSHHFVGIHCYADDIVLLAPSLNALCIQLSICEQFLKVYHLQFNSAKTQLICFTHSRLTTLPSGGFTFLW